MSEKTQMEIALASFQVKKASQLFAALKDLSGLDAELDVRYPEIIEWREYSKDGATKRHPVFFWHRGTTQGVAPSRQLRYVIKDKETSEIKTMKPSDVALETTYDSIFYRPAVVQMNIDGKKRLAAIRSFDSFFLPCVVLKQFDTVLDEDMKVYIEGAERAMKLLPQEDLMFKGPNQQACSLERYGDCRGCLRLMLQDCESWREARDIVESSTGLGTLYEDDNFVIRKNVSRAPYFYPDWIENWLEGRSKEHLIGLINELEEISELFSVNISKEQKEALIDVAKKITKSTQIISRIEALTEDAQE